MNEKLSNVERQEVFDSVYTVTTYREKLAKLALCSTFTIQYYPDLVEKFFRFRYLLV